jgi:hypothetical protein
LGTGRILLHESNFIEKYEWLLWLEGKHEIVFLNIIISTCLVSNCFAQASPPPTKIVVGPIPVKHQVQGISITIPITSEFSLNTQSEGVFLNADVHADLGELQRSFPALIDTIPLPRDNCKSYTIVNPVVSLGSRSLKGEGNTAVVNIAGDVDGWTCLENPVPQTYWDSTGCSGSFPWGGHYVFGCLRTRPGSPIKSGVGNPHTLHADGLRPERLEELGQVGVGVAAGNAGASRPAGINHCLSLHSI